MFHISKHIVHISMDLDRNTTGIVARVEDEKTDLFSYLFLWIKIFQKSKVRELKGTWEKKIY